MAKNIAETDAPGNPVEGEARALSIARSGVNTSADFVNLMNGITFDVLNGTLSPKRANAAVAPQRANLKMVEMQLKHGKQAGAGRRELLLVDPNREPGQDEDAAQSPSGPTPEQIELDEISRLKLLLDAREKEILEQQKAKEGPGGTPNRKVA